MEKKLIRQTIAAVLLSVSVLSITPTAYGKTTSIEQSIEVVKAQLKKIPTYYVYPALEGELAEASTLYPMLNSVKKSNRNIKNLILASNLQEKEKKAQLEEIEALYNEKITKGLIPYIDAYNYSINYLEPLLKKIKAAEAVNDLAAIEKAYHELSVQLKSRTSILYRFSGKASRDLLLEKYKKPSDSKRDELIVPVTIYMKVVQAEELMREGKKEQAKKILENVSSLIEELPNREKVSFIDKLLKEVKKVQALVGEVPIKSESPNTNPPIGNGGNGKNESPVPSLPTTDENTEPGQTPPNSGSETTTFNISGTVDNIANNSITVNAHSYKISKDLQKLFSNENKIALESATVTLEAKNGEIVKVKNIELNKDGRDAMDPLYLNANGAVIEGTVVINGNGYSIKNLIVKGDFTISPKIRYHFSFDNITVKGKTTITEEKQSDKNDFVSAGNPSEKELPSSYVYFNNSTIGTTEIAKENVLFTAGYNTKVKSIQLLKNGKISADDYITLPMVKIGENVSKGELSGNINNVYVDSANEVDIIGYSYIDNFEINTNKMVKLNTTGAIKNLKLNSTESTVFIGNETVIGNLEPQNNKTAEEVVTNYTQAAERIGQISGQNNEKFNLELKNKLKTDNFNARTRNVSDRFGYVKLDTKNEGENIVKYTLEKKESRETTLPSKGEQVPTEAIVYNKGDQFIAWHDYELVIYLVDDNGMIMDLVNPEELEWSSLEVVTLKQNNRVTLKTNTNVMDKSVSEIISRFDIYQAGIVHKLKDFNNYSWNFEDGIPTINFYLEGIKADKPSFYNFHYTRNEGSSSYLNNGYQDENLKIFVLYDSIDATNEEVNYFGGFLSNIYQYENKHPYDDPNYRVNFDSLSMNAYKQELRENKSNLQTAEAIKKMVDEVNIRLKDKIDLHKKAIDTVYKLFKEGNYGWYNEDQLADGVTQNAIDLAYQAVELLDKEFSEKEALKRVINKAQDLLILSNINSILVSDFNISSDVTSGSILTHLLYSNGENPYNPDKVIFEVSAVGQKVSEYNNYPQVINGSRFLEKTSNGLVLKAQNKTGKSATEYIQVSLVVDKRHIGNKIIKVTIDNTDLTDILLSDITNIVEYSSSGKVYSASNATKKVYVYEGIKVGQLINALTASDYSSQSYTIKNDSGAEMAQEDLVEEGTFLTVTAENEKASSEYSIQFVVKLTDIQKGPLGEVLFTAKNTNLNDLIENVKIRGSSDRITISQVVGIPDRYKINMHSAEENITYSFGGTNHFEVSDHNSWYFSWNTFTIEMESNSTNQSLIIKQETIKTSEDIQVNLMPEGSNSWEDKIEVDGVIITTEVIDIINGQGTIKFIASGTDMGSINNVTSLPVKITVDGKENLYNVRLYVEANGVHSVYIFD